MKIKPDCIKCTALNCSHMGQPTPTGTYSCMGYLPQKGIRTKRVPWATQPKKKVQVKDLLAAHKACKTLAQKLDEATRTYATLVHRASEKTSKEFLKAIVG